MFWGGIWLPGTSIVVVFFKKNNVHSSQFTCLLLLIDLTFLNESSGDRHAGHGIFAGVFVVFLPVFIALKKTKKNNNIS